MKRESNVRGFSAAIVVFLAFVATGCRVPQDTSIGGGTGGGGGGGDLVTPIPIPASTHSPRPAPTPTATPAPTPTATSAPSAQTCVSTDPNKQCLGLKLVAYVDPSTGIPTIDTNEAKTLLQQVNDVWSQCNIAFQLESFQMVDPNDYGLEYGYESEGELYEIREEFEERDKFLVVATGPWGGRTIAWTVMPGYGPFGTIVEKDYGKNPYTVGHELGHYMGLYHYNSSTNLMNAYIGSDTSGLDEDQCDIARETNVEEWQAMFRR